jgi:shikimate kinase / 3-dehydroquinate synthase
VNNVVLVGFMGSGKSTVGQHLSSRLQRPFVDLDEEICGEAGCSVAEIFAREGEEGFRAREARALARALQRDRLIIAAGGGAPLPNENWRQMRNGNTVVALTAEPAELARRLDGSNGRPLLEPDAPTAIASLLPARMSRYLESDLVVETDRRDPAAVAADVEASLPGAGLHRIRIDVPNAAHEVTIGSRLQRLIASTLRRLSSGPVLLVTDSQVGDRYAAPLLQAMSATGIGAELHILPPGEAAKELTVLSAIYDALAAAGVDRHGLLLALGGGTVGDVAGFAAATWMRGIRYLQVPTTLLAMVDSSIGGKTGINLPSGKNMVGAVHQPSAIFCDLDYLQSLSEADYRASLAEIIKAALIADRALVRWLSQNLAALLARDPAVLGDAVTRSIGIKASIVARDPDERNERAILNYGHTVGHALERAFGYGHIRHGEAVAWGMEVAARIGRLNGTTTEQAARAQHELLDQAGLLAKRPVVGRNELITALRHDKKSSGGEPRWVLLRDLGDAEFGTQIETAVVSTALHEVLSI